jgi:hypothetical protein
MISIEALTERIKAAKEEGKQSWAFFVREEEELGVLRTHRT